MGKFYTNGDQNRMPDIQFQIIEARRLFYKGTPDEYQDYIEAMSTYTLNDHAMNLQIRPDRDRRRTIAKLKKEFQFKRRDELQSEMLFKRGVPRSQREDLNKLNNG